MKIVKIDFKLKKSLYGVFTRIIYGERGKAGTAAMNKMWDIIQNKKLRHKGINHWIYISDEIMFVGVELDPDSASKGHLEKYDLYLDGYLHYRHIGPYYMLPRIHQNFEQYIKDNYKKVKYPIIEIFGHWNEDQSKLETDIIYPR